jgi:CubicO group peptidase (beta-lactamase class C family)
MKSILSYFIFLIIGLEYIQAQEIDQINQIFKDFDQNNSPGAVAIVVKNGEVIHLNGYGIANLEYNIPITSNTIFHIGSVSKQFTAFAILLLEERGVLSLEDYIGKYLQDLPEYKEQIKIKHLLHHTSGLREIEKLQQIAGITSADQIESSYLYNLIKSQKELNFSPGEELEYSNTNFFLLAKIVEVITKKSFRKWTKENIFEPLGMTSTFFYDDCSEIVKNRAYAYGDWDGELYKGILSYSYVGPTSLFTNGEDMAKWLACFSKKDIWKNLFYKMLTIPDTLNSGEPVDYGFGLGITSYKGVKVALHSGHDAYYRACTMYFPEQELGISILGNYYQINPYQYGFKIANELLKDFLKKDDVNKPEPVSEKKTEDFTLTPNLLMQYEGNYFCKELGVTYRIYLSEDKLKAFFWRNEEVSLKPINNELFEGDKYWFKQIEFETKGNSQIIGFSLNAGNVRNLFFKKL